jgi:ABC-type Fe3+-siderophore transport system permease subunit
MGEIPQDYWYIFPITIVVGAIGLLFLWAFARTVRRDLLPTRAP